MHPSALAQSRRQLDRTVDLAAPSPIVEESSPADEDAAEEAVVVEALNVIEIVAALLKLKQFRPLLAMEWYMAYGPGFRKWTAKRGPLAFG